MCTPRNCPLVVAPLVLAVTALALAAPGDPFPPAGVDTLASKLDLTVSFVANPYGLPVIAPTPISAAGTMTYTRGDPYASPPDGRQRINASFTWATTSTDLGGLTMAATGLGQLREVALSAAPGHLPTDSLMEAVLTLTLDNTPGITVFAEDSVIFTADGIDTFPLPVGTIHTGLGWLDEDVVTGAFEDLDRPVSAFPMDLYVDGGLDGWTLVGSVSAASHTVIPEPACAAALLITVALIARRRVR